MEIIEKSKRKARTILDNNIPTKTFNKLNSNFLYKDPFTDYQNSFNNTKDKKIKDNKKIKDIKDNLPFERNLNFDLKNNKKNEQ